MNRILLATALSTVFTVPAEAQWNLERNGGNTVATAVGMGGNMHLAVNCRVGSHVITLRLADALGFHNEVVEALWDDGAAERYTLRQADGGLSGSSESSEVKALIAKLRRSDSVRLRVLTGPEAVVTDRIELAGSSRAIGLLPCSLSDAEIRELLVRQIGCQILG